jgi:hypothetical protein
MQRFIIEQSEADITSHSGLALVGVALNQYTTLAQQAARTIQQQRGIAHADILRSYIGLLCLGKNDFEAVSNVREDDFFRTAMGIDTIPSTETLRQRLDAQAKRLLPLVNESSIEFLVNVEARCTALATGHVPLDADVTPFDNSQTQKEGVSRTYKGFDGYAPMAAYLGREGYCLEMELRAGKQHCQSGTPAFLKRILAQARRITDQPILLRLDGGNDAIENIATVLAHNEQAKGQASVDFLIKWNPRRERREDWLAYAQGHARWTEPREGKRVACFWVQEEKTWQGYDYKLPRVMRVIERTIDKHGQSLLVPEIELEGWWTSLDREPEDIIALYADHGTSEQFHSEFKTDLDAERLPSGKFDTNALVLSCAALAYNILRWIGQNGLIGPMAPIRHAAKRRRIRTVMQELMYLAARVVRTGRRIKLAFGRQCLVKPIFDQLYARLVYG